MTHRTWVEIDERALSQNIEQLRSLLTDGARFCAVLKANAYGHGSGEVARIAMRNGIDAFGVDNIDEALFLRDIAPSALILILGYTLHERLDEAIAADIHLTVYDIDTIHEIERVSAMRAKHAFIHMKIETGTHRQGVMEADLKHVLDEITACPHVRLTGIATHFANIEDTTDPRYATLQFTKFRAGIERVQALGHSIEWIHCANSAATILYPDTHGTLVRAGIALYGLWPSEIAAQSARAHNIACKLSPVLTWKTRVAQVKSVPAGSPISYGLTEVLKRNSRIAVLPVGYADGYDRGLSSIGEVIVGGSRCRVMGRVCMNMTMVDVSAVPNVMPEQEVVLLGRSGRHEITADKIATWAETINYEIVARINPLLPRVIV